MPPRSGPDQAELIADRAGEASAPVSEELAVGEVPRGRRAVVGQKYGGAPGRPYMNGAGDQLFAGAALAGDQDGEIVALQALDLFDHARHRRARAQETREQRLERLLVHDLGGGRGPLTCGAQLEPLRGDRADHAQPSAERIADGTRRQNRGIPGSVCIAADGLGDHPPCPLSVPKGPPGQEAGPFGIAPAPGDEPQVSFAGDEHGHGLGFGRFVNGRSGLPPQQIGQGGGVHETAHDGFVGVERHRAGVRGIGLGWLRRTILSHSDRAPRRATETAPRPAGIDREPVRPRPHGWRGAPAQGG